MGLACGGVGDGWPRRASWSRSGRAACRLWVSSSLVVGEPSWCVGQGAEQGRAVAEVGVLAMDC